MRGVVALLALAACGEHPSLRVEVEHPTDVTIATTSISVYESDLVTCDKVEFGDLSADELAAAEVDTITVGAGVPADELTMSRVDRKVIVARGFDADGANVSAGCAEKGVVGEGDELTIQTVLTAHVSVNGIGLDDADPFQIVVTVTDPLVRSLPDRVVSWRVNAAEGAQPIATANVTQGDDSDWVPTAPPCTNDSGIVRMHPVPPSTVGGFATSVRTSWSVEPPRTFTTFTPIDDSDRQSIIPVTDSKRWCALRVAGATRRLVCLENVAGTPTAFDYTVTASNGGARFAKNPVGQPITGLPSGEDPIGLVSIDRGAARDVYAITSKARAIGIFNPSIAADGAPKLLVGDASDVAVLPTCGQTRAALLVKVNGALQRELRTLAIDPTKPLGQGVSLMQYLSPSVTPPEDIDINRTGCVAELVPGGETIVHQVGVVDVSGRTGPGARNTTAGFFACNAPGGTCTIASPVGKAGVGFLPADDLHPERVVGTTFDASGFVLGVSVLQPDKLGIPRLVELERVTAASFPAHILAGQFDGDQRPDLFWDIPNLNNGSTNFQLAYAHQVGGQRLSAISTTQQDELVVDSFVADVTGDGKDDLVITSIDQLINPQLFEVRVIPGQIAIKPFTLMTDQPCGS